MLNSQAVNNFIPVCFVNGAHSNVIRKIYILIKNEHEFQYCEVNQPLFSDKNTSSPWIFILAHEIYRPQLTFGIPIRRRRYDDGYYYYYYYYYLYSFSPNVDIFTPIITFYICASCWSLVQRSPTECGLSGCDREASIRRKPWPTRGCWTTE